LSAGDRNNEHLLEAIHATVDTVVTVLPDGTNQIEEKRRNNGYWGALLTHPAP